MPALASFAAGSAKSYGQFKFRPLPARYFILQVLDIRSPSTQNIVQISEFNLMNVSTRLTASTYYNWNLSFTSAANLSDASNSPTNEEPYRANDANVNTKWLDFRGTGGGLWIDLGSNQESTGYQWYTANDADWRDPKTWRVWASQDDKTWFLLSDISGFTAPSARYTYAGSWDWIK